MALQSGLLWVNRGCWGVAMVDVKGGVHPTGQEDFYWGAPGGKQPVRLPGVRRARRCHREHRSKPLAELSEPLSPALSRKRERGLDPSTAGDVVGAASAAKLLAVLATQGGSRFTDPPLRWT